MLIPQATESDGSPRQGRPSATLDELRASLAEPTRLTEWHRQRLLELVQRLNRVRALGNGYAGVKLSPSAAAALSGVTVH